MSNLQSITVDLHISADEYLKYYRGHARVITCLARDGRRIQFPVPIMRRFLTRTGISGSFVIQFDSAGKFTDIERI